MTRTIIAREDLQRRLLREARMNPDCADLRHIAVYAQDDGKWAIGHVRVGPSRQWCERWVNDVQKRLRKQFLCEPKERHKTCI